MSGAGKTHTVVIGGGIVGACTALELARSGHAVTLLDRGVPGGRQSASYGHGCWISPASVVPMSMPGLWKRIPGYLLNPRGPLVIRWRNILWLCPWLVRFLLAGFTLSRVERTARTLSTLLADGPKRHEALAREIGRPDLIRREGLLYVYPDRAAFQAETTAWHLRRMTGLRWSELDEAQLRRREPDLSPHYTFAILVEDGAHCTEPDAYVSAIVAAAVERGATVRQSGARDLTFAGERIVAVETDGGRIECDRVVIAAGVWSKRLAAKAGDVIPLESERGYHGVIPSSGGGPRHPIMPSDGKMANTPTARGLRLAGQVELASIDTPPSWERVDILLHHALRTYPNLETVERPAVDRWMGHRPSTADGVPVIGTSSRSPDVFYAFGHGHVGFASGPITGRIVAGAICGGAEGADIAPFSPRRFRRSGTGKAAGSKH